MTEIGDSGLARSDLEAAGFLGWATFDALVRQLTEVPQTGGVYVVVQAAGASADFLDANPGGRFKGRDPSVEASALEANWVADAEVVYIGKADNLRRRLRQFAQFGAGKPIGHWGGRLIWQLSQSATLEVAWRETPGQVPKEVEDQMLIDFRAAYGEPPFANERVNKEIGCWALSRGRAQGSLLHRCDISRARARTAHDYAVFRLRNRRSQVIILSGAPKTLSELSRRRRIPPLCRLWRAPARGRPGAPIPPARRDGGNRRGGRGIPGGEHRD